MQVTPQATSIENGTNPILFTSATMARQLNISRPTVYAYLRRDTASGPRQLQRRPSARVLTPYIPYLIRRWREKRQYIAGGIKAGESVTSVIGVLLTLLCGTALPYKARRFMGQRAAYPHNKKGRPKAALDIL